MAADNSIVQCLRALEVLAGSPRGLPLIEFARQLNLPKASSHRLLATMMRANFVKQDPLTHHYLLTLRLTTLGYRFVAGTKIIDLYMPALERLAARTMELVRMTVAEGNALNWVAKVQGSRTGLRFDPEMGDDVHLLATASGRVWLASQPMDAVLSAIVQHGFGPRESLGPNAPKDAETFLSLLESTRRDGFGLAVDESEPGMSAIAVTIDGPRGSPAIGTLSVAGPTARLDPERLKSFLEPLRETAAELASIWSFARSRSEELSSADTQETASTFGAGRIGAKNPASMDL